MRPNETTMTLFNCKPIQATHHETVIGRLYVLGLPPTTLAALTAVVAHTSPDKQWKSFPAYERLMAVAGIGNRRTLSVHLADLEERGYLVKRRRPSKSTLYQLTQDLFNALQLRTKESLPLGDSGNSDTGGRCDTDTTSSGNTDTLTNTTQQTPSNRHQLNDHLQGEDYEEVGLIPSTSELGLKPDLKRESDEEGGLPAPSVVDPDSQWELKVRLCRTCAVQGAEALLPDEYALVWSAYHEDEARLRDALSSPEVHRIKDIVEGDF